MRFAWSFLVFTALALPAFAQKTPAEALASMKAGDGLQVELFACEPMVINPTATDIDHLGRVWVTEAVNYRRVNFGRKIIREEGDRIQVLIDEKGEGKATKAITFYQGKEIYGPLSVCVIPTNSGKSLRVLVAQSPDIFEFTCKDSSNPVADGPPKKFLTGFGGFDHDHGVHGLHLGPDGKLYFTVGDQGVGQGTDSNKKPVGPLKSSDGKGREWKSNNTDCQAGTIWRCDLDGKNLELIAHNFRNNYEAAVDSFGEIWCSDNDDDGNQQTRICFVMPGGNYGYFPRGAGQSHWHEEQPGIVHKTLRTGFGSPTGIQFYEGTTLPKQYHNTLMHCDAGPREVRAFTRKAKGAGYELDKALMLTSNDAWFRPSDVCTAPDGSVMVADWYDPGVGGHGMGDWTRGRVYRLTPTGSKGYKVPEVKLDTKEGVLAALGSPCQAVRAAAQAKLLTMPMTDAFDTISQGMSSSQPSDQVRAFTMLFDVLLGNGGERLALPKEASERCDAAMAAFNKSVGKTTPGAALGIRLGFGRVNQANMAAVGEPLSLPAGQLDEIVRLYGLAVPRELAMGIRNTPIEQAKPILYTLTKLYDGTDRTYLSALNIACGIDAERRDKILADFEKHFPEWNDKVADLVWELRPKSMMPKLGSLMTDAKLTAAQKAHIVDILAASNDISAGKTMLGLLKGDAAAEVKEKALTNLKLFLPTKWKDLTKGDELKSSVDGLLAKPTTRVVGLQLIAAAKYYPALDQVKEFCIGEENSKEVKLEAIRTLGALPCLQSAAALGSGSYQNDDDYFPTAAQALAQQISGPGTSDEAKMALMILGTVLMDKKSSKTARQTALQALAGTRAGTGLLLKIKESNEMPESMIADAGRLLRNSPFQGERNKAMILFPAAGKLDPKKLPPIAELAKKVGNIENGRQVMAKSVASEVQCLKCHMVRGTGGNIGPDLSMIGKKGSKENLYDSLLTPSKAIADQYVSWKLDAEDGQSITGLLVGETETTLTIRDANGKDYQFPVKGTEKRKDAKSIMPEDLVKTLTEDELIDVVEYLMTLQTPSFTPDSWLIAGPFASDISVKHGPEKAPFDIAAKFGDVSWRNVRSGSNGYFDLAAFHGKKSTNSVSYVYRVIDSPTEQDVTLLVGTDDACRLTVNGKEVLSHDRAEAASAGRDAVKLKLNKGANTVLMKISNGDNPHGFYFTIEGGLDLKIGK